MDVIGPLQLRVMKFIWKNGPSTVHAVHDALNDEKGAPTLAYTTILTVMRNLAKREILEQTAQGRSHVFAPLLSDNDYRAQVLQAIRNDLFAGKTKAMLEFIEQAPEFKRGRKKA
ncbi:MAG: BlaI/MecI/CopY family transcriptional regulator [Planctomycetota bacterium]|nr:MAG: BlaI/MecI/CopY family transcriptional regulator [Planctomycetota bacterium]